MGDQLFRQERFGQQGQQQQQSSKLDILPIVIRTSVLKQLDNDSKITKQPILKKYIQHTIELLKIMYKDPKIQDKVRNEFTKQLDNIDTKYFDKTTLIYYFRNKLLEYYSNPDINIKGQSIRHSLMEVYTISRMFRKFEKKSYNFICDINENSLKNILYYTGDEHIINIKSFIINILKIKN